MLRERAFNSILSLSDKWWKRYDIIKHALINWNYSFIVDLLLTIATFIVRVLINNTITGNNYLLDAIIQSQNPE